MENSSIPWWLNRLGILLIIVGFIFGFYFGSDNSGFGYSLDLFVLFAYIIGGAFSGLLCIGFAKIVEAAEKYLNS